MKNPKINFSKTLYVVLARGTAPANNKPIYLPQDIDLNNKVITNIFSPSSTEVVPPQINGDTYTIGSQASFLLTMVNTKGKIVLENFPLSMLTTINQKGRLREFNHKFDISASYLVLTQATGVPNIATSNYVVPITFFYK